MTENEKKEEIRTEADLHRFAIGGVLREKYVDMEYEFERFFGIRMRMDYAAMATLNSMARAQARGFPQLLAKYDQQTHLLNAKFGNIEERRWKMRPEEAGLRKELLENLLYDLGPSRIDERPEAIQPTVYDYEYSVDGRDLIHGIFRKRLGENRNLVILFTGQVGGGKSFASITTADYLTKSLNVGFDLKGLVFTIPEFIQHIRDGKPGDVVILDEAGVAAGSRDALTKGSKSLSKVIQSIRYLQYCTIFSLPNVNFLDKQIRLMIDLVFQHDAEMRQGEFRVLIPQLTPDGTDVEYAGMRHGQNRLVRTAYFPLPRPALIEDYEKVRRQHNMEKLKELQENLEGDKKKDSAEDGRGKNPNSRKNLKQYKEGDEEDE